jgi:pimeloyl-ACP methyl ester carboxylesterase
VRGPVSLFAGTDDQIFRAEQFAPLLKPIRSDLTVTVLPGIDHMGMTVKPAAVETIAAAVNQGP